VTGQNNKITGGMGGEYEEGTGEEGDIVDRL